MIAKKKLKRQARKPRAESLIAEGNKTGKKSAVKSESTVKYVLNNEHIQSVFINGVEHSGVITEAQLKDANADISYLVKSDFLIEYGQWQKRQLEALKV